MATGPKSIRRACRVPGESRCPCSMLPQFHLLGHRQVRMHHDLTVMRPDFTSVTPLDPLMAGFHLSDLFEVCGIGLRLQRDHQHGGGYDEEREDPTCLRKHSIRSIVRLDANSAILSEASCRECIKVSTSPSLQATIKWCSLNIKQGRVPLCVLPSESLQATAFLNSHENLLGNCIAHAVVNVSAMT
jgi:hypothetical protein